MSTVCAISTPVGRSGLGIVRMTGDESFDIIQKIFRGKTNLKNRFMTYGNIVDGDEIIDEVLTVYMKAPHTYTREDVVEIYTHGGVVAVKKVLETLLKNGADLAEPGEFTKRAFLNGRIDLTQAEAVRDIIDSNTSLNYKNSLNQLGGSLYKEVEAISDGLMEVMASSIAEIDFPDDENDVLSDDEKIERLSPLLSRIDKLIENSKRAKIIKNGIKTLILGRPNVGKSSLLNALLKENRAIVTDIPGTTRDTIEEVLDLDGIPINLIDTAGIRNTEDEVEKIGVDIAKNHIEDADLILLVFDSSSEVSDEDMELLDLVKDKEKIIILNKTDLEKKFDTKKIENMDYIEMSIIENEGIDILFGRIKSLYFDDKISSDDNIYVSNIRQIEHLRRAGEYLESAISAFRMNIPLDLVEVDLNFALEELGNITGKTTNEDILDRIFSEFCIGK